jgi:2-(1,2-epoxy-1,2-dihydrophenyl)acetyl-CoA isomerase
LMAGCELIIAAEDCRFLMAYDRIGAAMDCGGTWYLPRRIGRARATELMLLSEVWTAARALEVGLINRVVPADALASETSALANRLAQRPTGAFAAWRRLIDGAETRTLEDHLEMERVAFRQATRTRDFAEGVSAFLGKREPHFTGD